MVLDGKGGQKEIAATFLLGSMARINAEASMIPLGFSSQVHSSLQPQCGVLFSGAELVATRTQG